LTPQHDATERVENSRLPIAVDELTKDWLQFALADVLGSEKIESFSAEIIGIGEGFMGQLARVSLGYADGPTDAPKSVIAKFASTRPETREMARDQNLYKREIGFYRDIGQDVGVPVPACYYSELIEESNFFVMILEDLAPGIPSDQVMGTDRETSREVIEQFAKLHAKWWNSDKLEDYDWAKWLIQETPIEAALVLFEESMKQAEATGKFDAYPEMKRLMPFLPPLFKLDPAPPFPFTLTHGDLRSDNIIRPSALGGRFAVIDWQLTGIGDPASDITRWLVQSISIEDRKETEKELLKLYHDRLVEYGVKHYSYRKFINDYKTNLIVVLLMFSMSMDAVDQSSDRAKALFHQFYSRLDSALVDWEIEKPLKALPYIYPFIKVGLLLKKAFRKRS
jgi:thiamine kinase-like enzyme